ncbi:MAG: hypothetical protein HC821_00740, partial [Lewinella sp.]|nr:hypothetical protein [Lewinella sp.]
MNLAAYIARRVVADGRRSFSRLIIRIAIVSVALSMTVMIVATALIAGFKSEISSKIFGFWGHIIITDSGATYSLLENFNFPIAGNQDFYPALDTVGPIPYRQLTSFLGQEIERPRMTRGGVRHIQQFAVLPGLVKSFPAQENEDLIMEGMILKGVGSDFDWDFFSRYLVAGQPLVNNDSTAMNGIIVSQSTARRLRCSLGDRLEFSFLRSENRQIIRMLTVVGIFKTGLEEYDREFALVPPAAGPTNSRLGQWAGRRL